MNFLFILIVLNTLIPAHPIDLKFRWRDGFCQKNNNPGLNPNYMGECGNLASSRIISQTKNDSNFKGSNFNSVYAYLFHIQNTDLSHTSFRRSVFLQSKILNLNADYIDFRGALIKSVYFENVSMKDMLATGTRFNKTQFISCDLSNANFQGASLHETQFLNSNLSGAKLKNTSLLFTNFTGSKYNAATELPFDDQVALEKGMIKID